MYVIKIVSVNNASSMVFGSAKNFVYKASTSIIVLEADSQYVYNYICGISGHQKVTDLPQYL